MSTGSGSFRNSASSLTAQVKKEELLRFLLTGHSVKECAKLMQLSYGTVVKYCRDQDLLDRLKSYSEQVFTEVDKQIALTRNTAYSRIEELSLKALDRLEQLIESEREGIALKACQDVLDRNEETPRNRKFEAEVQQRVFDPAALMHAALVAAQLERYEHGVTTIDQKPEPEAGAD